VDTTKDIETNEEEAGEDRWQAQKRKRWGKTRGGHIKRC
jgi:hypothetical protein